MLLLYIFINNLPVNIYYVTFFDLYFFHDFYGLSAANVSTYDISVKHLFPIICVSYRSFIKVKFFTAISSSQYLINNKIILLIKY